MFNLCQIVVVPDAKTSKKVPPVPGIMQYRQDEKKLYIRSNETWEVLEPERKVPHQVNLVNF